jgi:hypothetical protein
MSSSCNAVNMKDYSITMDHITAELLSQRALVTSIDEKCAQEYEKENRKICIIYWNKTFYNTYISSYYGKAS